MEIYITSAFSPHQSISHVSIMKDVKDAFGLNLREAKTLYDSLKEYKRIKVSKAGVDELKRRNWTVYTQTESEVLEEAANEARFLEKEALINEAKIWYETLSEVEKSYVNALTCFGPVG